jgi:hypothetical protein
LFEQLINPPATTTDRKYDGWSLDDRDPQFIREVFMPMWKWYYDHYFRVTTDGWEHVPSQGRMLVVGSHNGGLAAPDMFMLMYDWFDRFGTGRPAYGRLLRQQFERERRSLIRKWQWLRSKKMRLY